MRSRTMSGMPRLLVVDDEAPIRGLLKRALRHSFDVSVAADGIEALDLILKDGFDVILSDFNMPRMDGKALYEALDGANLDAARRIVFMSGNLESGDVRAFLTGRRYAEKPFDVGEVRAMLLDVASAPRPGGG